MLITTLVVSFCKDGRGSVNVKLCFLVVYVGCEVLCRLVVAGNVFLLIQGLSKRFERFKFGIFYVLIVKIRYNFTHK